MSSSSGESSKPPTLLIFIVTARRAPGQLRHTRLHDYIDAIDDPFLPQRFASHVHLPHHAHRHHDPNYRGESPRTIGTSLMVEEGDGSHALLPCLSRSIESLASGSTHSSMGARQLAQHFRTLDVGPDNLLVADRRPHAQPVLQCPFAILGCISDFSVFEDWFWHSVEHFDTGLSNPAFDGRAVVMPPTKNRCCFCSKTFFDPNGIRSWCARMYHIAFYHHWIGHSLSHARPDFQLFDYLWETHLIDEIMYREIKGNTPDQSRLTHGNPSPPTSDRSDSPPATPPGAVAVLNESRHSRRRTRY